jgi:hypothetical protein
MSFIFSILVHSCIEPFIPRTSNYDEQLLIEGLITDSPMIPAKVAISRTVPLGNSTNPADPVGSDALVMIVCDDGAEYSLTETSIGVYTDVDHTIQLEEGRLYKLIVQTKDGAIFESGFESYRPSPPIDSITYSPEVVITSELQSESEGLQFYVHSKSLDDNPIYLRWILDATYQYWVPFVSNFIWHGSFPLEEFNNDTLMVCWKDESIKGIYIGDSYGLVQNRVTNAPLNFVSQIGDRLMAKYSLHVVQLSISESVYKFWYDLNKLINESGGLYETQPFRLEGNIYCTSDHDIQVTGVFEVAGVSEKRVFASRPEGIRIFSRHCQLDTIQPSTLPWEAVRAGSYIYGEPEVGLYMTAPDFCFDCRARGGTTIRPPFWE